MDTQQQKKILVESLGRNISDNTFYRIKRDLKSKGFTTTKSLLATVGNMNRKTKIIRVASQSVIQAWEKVEIERFRGKTKLECIRIIESFISVKPKDRKLGKKIYPSTLWYRWFEQAGIVLKLASVVEEEELQSLIIVVSLVVVWAEKKRNTSKGI